MYLRTFTLSDSCSKPSSPILTKVHWYWHGSLKQPLGEATWQNNKNFTKAAQESNSGKLFLNNKKYSEEPALWKQNQADLYKFVVSLL